jgi:DNA-binding MarR family transcriptional regulator
MGSVRWLGTEEQRAWRGYRRMFLLLNAQVARDLLADSGLSEADYDVLSTLSETKQRRERLSVLSARMLWEQSRLSHHITRMQRRGLVEREEAPDDGRGSVIALTRAGMQAVRSAAPKHVAAVRAHMIDRLTADEIRVLGDITEKIVAGLSGEGTGSQRD